ncbi:beta-2 adrenergic receptor-like isoform X2 [Montipora foliosa]|uniref:beta-2 adrenergic receptor-like isoform X2 n=1 Tax=Montipora foliosa TaxID=591990 RepID=UPI0035F20676
MDGSSTWKSNDNSTCTVDAVPKSLTIAALVLCFLTVFGNSLVVIAIVKDPYRELKTIPNYLILNLAVCDLIVGIPSELLLGFLHFIPEQSSFYGHFYFFAYTSLYFAMVASSLTILTLAFERYIMVEAPFRSKEFLGYSHLKLSIVYIWLLAACAALLFLLNQCNEKEYRLIIVDAIGFSAMVFMFIIYSRIFYLVRKCIRQDLENSLESSGSSLLASDDFNENLRRREREIAMSVFLFVGAFALFCWTPCCVMENIFYKASIEKRPSLETPADWVRFSGLLSSLLNPVIYALRYGKFRRAVRAIFRSYCGRTHRFSVLSEEFIRPVV